jgi:hypothetical protein
VIQNFQCVIIEVLMGNRTAPIMGFIISHVQGMGNEGAGLRGLTRQAAVGYQTRVSNGGGERKGHEDGDDTGYMGDCGKMEARAEVGDEQSRGVWCCWRSGQD